MYKQFFAILKQTGQSKEDMVLAHTEGRTSSLRAMKTEEFHRMVNNLKQLVEKEKQVDERDNIRKAIIAQFHRMEYAKPAQAAKAWAEKMGVGRGEENVKKNFNAYSKQELMKLLTKAKLAVRDYENALRKRLKILSDD